MQIYKCNWMDIRPKTSPVNPALVSLNLWYFKFLVFLIHKKRVEVKCCAFEVKSWLVA